MGAGDEAPTTQQAQGVASQSLSLKWQVCWGAGTKIRGDSRGLRGRRGKPRTPGGRGPLAHPLASPGASQKAPEGPGGARTPGEGRSSLSSMRSAGM